jgi:hypothetical protein
LAESKILPEQQAASPVPETQQDVAETVLEAQQNVVAPGSTRRQAAVQGRTPAPQQGAQNHAVTDIMAQVLKMINIAQQLKETGGTLAAGVIGTGLGIALTSIFYPTFDLSAKTMVGTAGCLISMGIYRIWGQRFRLHKQHECLEHAKNMLIAQLSTQAEYERDKRFCRDQWE